MKQYGDYGREWSMEKKFEQIALAGFKGMRNEEIIDDEFRKIAFAFVGR
jgi:hypothetical protein